MEELQVKVFWPRPVWPLWELGQTGVFLSILPLPWPLCLGLFGALAGWVPCSALFRAAINQVIWLPSCFESSDTSVAANDHVFTFSFVSSFLLSAFLSVTISWEYMVLGLPWKYLIESQICLHTLWNSWSLSGMPPHSLLFSQGALVIFGWEYPPAWWWRRALSHCYLKWPYRSFASGHQIMPPFKK